MNIEELKELRKELDRKSIEYKVMTLVLGECETIMKRAGSVDVATIVRKLIKANQDTLKYGSNETLEVENKFLETLLPTQFTKDEIVSLIMEQGITSLGEAMKFLKTSYAGMYDGRVASVAIRECL